MGRRKPLQGGGSFADKYSWLSYAQVQELRNAVGSYLRQEHFSTVRSELKSVGLYSINRPEWVIVEQACNAYSLVSVALCTHFVWLIRDR